MRLIIKALQVEWDYYLVAVKMTGWITLVKQGSSLFIHTQNHGNFIKTNKNKNESFVKKIQHNK